MTYLRYEYSALLALSCPRNIPVSKNLNLSNNYAPGRILLRPRNRSQMEPPLIATYFTILKCRLQYLEAYCEFYAQATTLVPVKQDLYFS